MECLDRAAESAEIPVQLVVIDMDETLKAHSLIPKKEQKSSGSPNLNLKWLTNDRTLKLSWLFDELISGADGQPRKLAALTTNPFGAHAVLTVLKLAGLAEYFSVIWVATDTPVRKSGAYLEQGEWKPFDHGTFSSKADVLEHVASCPEQWFPQMTSQEAAAYDHLRKELTPDGILLVGGGEQSPRTVPRRCKVAKENFGFVEGGIAALDGSDYGTLLHFVQRPHLFHKQHVLYC
jgi:hypothetical protein